jgi:prepilin-type N-terminal cleavage/methylation domain-containing protein
MRRQRDKVTRGQGDRTVGVCAGSARHPFTLSPCHPLSSPRGGQECPRDRRRRAAFTLPEVLAALVLIGIVLPAVLKGVSLAMAACDDAKRKIEATGLAETKLAELTAEASQQVSSGGGSGDFAPDHPEYRWDATTASADADLSELTVRVAWTARGAERTVELSTFLFTGTAGTSSPAAPSAAGGGT